MSAPRCPGQDQRFWKPEDIFYIQCPFCGTEIEFWKDEPLRPCSSCGKEIRNPRLDLGCAKWCQYAEECLGMLPETPEIAAPIIDRLTSLLEGRLADTPGRLERAGKVHAVADTLLAAEGGDPLLVKASALLAGAATASPGEPPSSCAWLHEKSARLGVLEASGIGSEAVGEIWAIVDAVIDDEPRENIEFAIVWDAVRIVTMPDRESAGAADLPVSGESFKTRSGRQAGQQRQRRAK